MDEGEILGYPAAFWIGFHLLIALLMAADLLLFHRKRRPLSFKEACVLSGFWVLLALLFNIFVHFYIGSGEALQFFTGYLIEKSLSVDNLFVFLLIFLQFKIVPEDQHKILFWGILGALILRISLILAGVALIERFHWMFYVFGTLLVVSGCKLLLEKKGGANPSDNFLFKLLHKILPVSKEEAKGRFFVNVKGKWKVTSLFLALVIIEFTDVIFALDSIPAIFAITTNPFIVYTSNIFAILGLRALHFVLAPSLEKLYYFKWGLAAILVFVGAKMLFADFYPLSVATSLLVIVALLAATVLASLLLSKKSSQP